MIQRSNAFGQACSVTISNAVGQKLLSTLTTGLLTTVKKTFPAGIYLVTVNAGGVNTTKRVIIN